ncbi:MAG: hypothetical protein AAF502_25650 [Bacteroidota bacterium]
MDSEKQIAEGFNAGYLIEKHRPELAKEMRAKVQEMESPFIEGFVAGAKEYARERGISKLRGKASKTFSPKPKDKTRDEKGFDIER